MLHNRIEKSAWHAKLLPTKLELTFLFLFFYAFMCLFVFWRGNNFCIFAFLAKFIGEIEGVSRSRVVN